MAGRIAVCERFPDSRLSLLFDMQFHNHFSEAVVDEEVR